jgi:predicted DNA-binding transcriptional regulator AlpA
MPVARPRSPAAPRAADGNGAGLSAGATSPSGHAGGSWQDLYAVAIQMPEDLAALDVDAVPAAALPALLATLLAVQGGAAAVAARVIARFMQETSGDHVGSRGPDRFLTIREGAARVGMTPQYVYEHQAELPFVVRVGTRALRISEARLERYMARRRMPL